MSKLLTLIVLLLVQSSCAPVKFVDPYDEIDYNNLKGDLSFVEYYTIHSKKSLMDSSKVLIYYENKLPVKLSEIRGKHKTTSTMIYNDQNQLTDEVYTSDTPTRIKYSYDARGNLIKMQYVKENEIDYETRMMYDKKDNVIRIDIFNDNILSTRITNFYNYSNLSSTSYKFRRDKKIETFTTRFYNRKGKVIKSQNHTPSKNRLGEILFFYDCKGNIIREEKYINSKPTFHTDYQNTYDANNNIIKIVKYSNDILFSTTYYHIKYNKTTANPG